jgi:clan AA aspartic protease (TIGR02281 family)
MRALCIVVPLAAGLLCLPATAEIYRWTDAEGRLHFTENLSKVPLAQRDEARRAAAKESSRKLQTYSAAAAHVPERKLAVRRGGEIRVPFVRDGSLMRVEVRLNDQVTTPFYIDTGASGVSLPSHVAEQLGIRIHPDMPHVRVVTANGMTSRPLVTLEAVELGAARVEGLEATVNPAMSIGLLGGTFFNNFVYRVDAAESEIRLVPNERIRGGLREQEWRTRFLQLREPLARVDSYLEEAVVLRKGERARLERRRSELANSLEELEQHANRLDVPYKWRR